MTKAEDRSLDEKIYFIAHNLEAMANVESREIYLESAIKSLVKQYKEVSKGYSMQQDWLLVEIIKQKQVTVSQADVRDTEQVGVVKQAGDGKKYTANGVVEIDMTPFQTGVKVTWIAHAEANTTEDMKRQGLAYVEAAKVIQVGE